VRAQPRSRTHSNFSRTAHSRSFSSAQSCFISPMLPCCRCSVKCCPKATAVRP
jgi:hypothetical protein